MTVQNGKYSTSAEHRRHDRLLVTRFAMDDAYPGERDEARALVERCAECAALAADIRLIASSMKRLPAPARPREFTITEEQADRLRGNRLAQWLRRLSAPGWTTLRPVAGVALSIGLVMAFVGSTIPSASPASGVPSGETLSEAAPDGVPDTVATPAPEKAPEAPTTNGGQGEVVVPAPAAAGSPGAAPPDIGAEGPQEYAQASPDAMTRELDRAYLESSPSPLVLRDGDDTALTAPADPVRDLLIYSGLAIAAISLALLALAWTARRWFADPLLR